jgi:cyclopropane fatty-acyl-phospholipid synthase-like methyltransferase
MKPGYLKYYEDRSAMAPLVFTAAAWRAKNNVARQAMLNRLKDYQNLAQRPELLPLHRRLNELLLKGVQEWDSYDYGEGYFYQGLHDLGITGLRDTDARIEAMQLVARVRGRRVLEIGCNTGFIAMVLARTASRLVGFDINPHLIEIGRESARFLHRENAEFHVSSFEDFRTENRFDAVLSFANHSTYDRNTRQSLESYFDRCYEFLEPEGLLLFESHPPAHEGEGLTDVVRIIGERFTILESRVLDYGTFLDRGRTFMMAERPS